MVFSIMLLMSIGNNRMWSEYGTNVDFEGIVKKGEFIPNN
jgi:hypothetical protein